MIAETKINIILKNLVTFKVSKIHYKGILKNIKNTKKPFKNFKTLKTAFITFL